MANLQKKQRGLQGEINKKRREANQLNARIDKLIAEEIERARKRAEEEARREAAARKKAEGKESQTAGTGTTVKTNSKPLETYTMSKADRELSGNFVANRGKGLLAFTLFQQTLFSGFHLFPFHLFLPYLFLFLQDFLTLQPLISSIFTNIAHTAVSLPEILGRENKQVRSIRNGEKLTN